MNPDGTVAFYKNVIIGKSYGHKSPIFEKEIQYVVFRPYWEVTPSIQRNEIVPHILKSKSGLRHLSLILLFLPLLGHGAESASPAAQEYRLRFYYTHTGERLDVVYRRGDQYIPEALEELDHFLRDHRTGDVRHFDPHLFDLLHDLTASLGDSRGEIDVICGYRTSWSNEFLRARNPHTGVAQHSLHMQAEAIDIRLPGIPTSELRDAVLRLHRGGVGYYRSSDFVHVDVGRVRHW
jgi:uncharacterized protein YcbK (DUF882 family)